jgi:hypothetical protein
MEETDEARGGRGRRWGDGAALALLGGGGGGLLWVVLSARAGLVVAAGALLFVAGLAWAARWAVRRVVDWRDLRRGAEGGAPLLAFAALAGVVAAAAAIAWLLLTGSE